MLTLPAIRNAEKWGKEKERERELSVQKRVFAHW